MYLIKLPFRLGLVINEELKKKGIEHRTNSGAPTFEYTQEELDQIEKLIFNNPMPGTLKGLESLHNLKVLKISSSYSPYSNNNMSINDQDISAISKTTSLEELTIRNQSNITWIDVTDLTSLKSLTVERNVNVDTIEGLTNLNNLYEVNIFGNKEIYEIKGIEELVNKNDLSILSLDLLSFSEVSSQIPKMLQIPSCKFYEACSAGTNLSYNCGTAMMFHKECLNIVKDILSQHPANNKDLVILVDSFLANHISYDYDALNRKGRYHEENGIRKGFSDGTQSAYNGIMYGSCVCEGYTKSMQYLLKQLNIKTRGVHCIQGKDQIKVDDSYSNKVERPDDGYHSIIRVDLNEGTYYCDPCWDSCYLHAGDSSLPYCLKNKQDISEDHTLSFEENIINGQYPSIDPEYIQAVINRKTLMENANSSQTK